MKVRFKKIKKSKIKRDARKIRHRRVRSKVLGNEKKPRLSVFRSNKYSYAQLVDDATGRTIVSANDLELKGKEKLNKIETAKEVGKLIAKKAQAKKINKIVFDRSGYKFHGRIRAVAEGAREGGLQF
jgi:large subunit ribosomal protein L18